MRSRFAEVPEGKITPELRAKAQKGNLEAQYELGMIYGGSKHIGEAAKWLRKSAEQGNSEAALQLGAIYTFELRDPVKAAKWYLAAAKSGDPAAQCALASCYDLGEGVKVDAEALKWLLAAAEAGLRMRNARSETVTA